MPKIGICTLQRIGLRQKVTLLMDAAEFNSTAGGGAIGRKLLELRSNKLMKNVSLGEIVSMGKQTEREWMELKALTLT